MLPADLVAYCGLYCGDCGGYSREMAEAARSLIEAMERYRFDLTARELFSEQLPDYAGLMESLRFMSGLKCDATCRERSEKCEIGRCCTAKGLDGCHECDEFEGCSSLATLEGLHGDSCVRNLRAIREDGRERWASSGIRHWFGSEVDPAE
jgi:hypothetical protein